MLDLVKNLFAVSFLPSLSCKMVDFYHHVTTLNSKLSLRFIKMLHETPTLCMFVSLFRFANVWQTKQSCLYHHSLKTPTRTLSWTFLNVLGDFDFLHMITSQLLKCAFLLHTDTFNLVCTAKFIALLLYANMVLIYSDMFNPHISLTPNEANLQH